MPLFAVTAAETSGRNREFERFYESELLPALEAMEANRRRWHRAAYLVPVAVAAVIAVFFAPRLQAGSAAMALLFGPAVGYIGVLAAVRHLGFRDRYKREIIGAVARFARPDLAYDHKGSISREEFSAGGMFDGFTGFSGEDLFSGRIGDAAVRYSELTVSKRIGEESAIVFRGVYLIADLARPCPGLTLVRAVRLGQEKKDWFESRLPEVRIPRPGEPVELGDREFERRFTVHSTNPAAARSLLTPLLREKLTALDKRCNEQLSLSFQDSRLHLAIGAGAGGLFEPDIRTSLKDRDRYLGMYADIRILAGLAGELDPT